MLIKKVQVWIYRKQSESHEPLFLLLRTSSKRGAFWQPVTGGVDADEGVEDAAQREAKEETGLEFNGLPISLNSSFEFEKKGTHFHEFGFLLEAKTTEVSLDAGEHDAYEWLTAAAAMEKIQFDSNKIMLGKVVQSLNPKS